jgi:sugar transferase (PEP-CTERM/EpsH1 system associated)
MEILFVVPYTPNLIRARPYNLIRSLAARGHRITVATLWSSEAEHETTKRLESFCEAVYTLPLPAWRSMLNCLVALPTTQPLQAVYCWQPDLARKITALLKSSQNGRGFDIVHVEHLRGAKYGLHLQPNGHPGPLGATCPPIVWDSVDSISLLFRQSSAHSKRLAFRFLTKFELSRTERFEARLVKQFSKMLVTSQRDRNAFLALLAEEERAKADITVIPNGVDLDYFTPDPECQREPATLVVSGKMSYHANVSMVKFLVDEIMPKIWATRPETKLWIVGKDPTKHVAAYANLPNVTVTGTVEDIRPYLRKATVAVVPLTYGAGTQFKVLEGMGCAAPVVATPLAVSGLNTLQGCEVMVAKDASAFATSVLRLLEHEELRQAVGQAGRLYVEQNYHWAEIAKKLEGVYDAINQDRL